MKMVSGVEKLLPASPDSGDFSTVRRRHSSYRFRCCPYIVGEELVEAHKQ